MVKSLHAIKGPIEQELKLFEQRFRDSMRSQVPLLDKIMYYIVKRKGKEVRPMFVFLSAKICGETNDASYDAASLVELLHTATLVHDDVVDDSNRRTSFFSINTLWKNKIAVIVGDYLMTQALSLALKRKEFKLLEIVATAFKEMSEGELWEIEKTRLFDLTETDYYSIIRQKSASLIAAACSAGAASISKTPDDIEKMRLFGEKIGIAFHIRDDLFSVSKLSDLKEIKISLPLVHVLEKTTDATRHQIINTIKRDRHQKKERQALLQLIRKEGGITYAEQKMILYRQEAFDILDEFPDSPAKQSLKDLVVFITDRKK